MNTLQHHPVPAGDKHQRLKRTLIQNTSYSLVNYFLATVLTLAAVGAGLSSMDRTVIVVLGAAGTVMTMLCMGITAARRTVTGGFSLAILLAQYLFFLIIFALWVAFLNEARYISLFVIVVTCLFLIFESTFLQAIVVISLICLTYAGGLWYGVERLGQQGTPLRDLFMLACFAPSGILIAVIARRFRQQRLGLAAAKRQSDQARGEAEQARDALWGEMELAKKIQTVLLPVQPAISGFEIAAYMKPADEVGGDYYDIINVEGRDWVVIGDVSGHGVSAGLIMMIVQTAIKMALAQSPGIEPSKLLSLINRTISHDIRKISDDKYMTITVLALHENGRFHFSGLHQDIILYRAASGVVETVVTDGMWLGIMQEIAPLMADSSLSMAPGDVMMIFTDGITEAWRLGSVVNHRDPGADMFGQDRLLAIMARTGIASPGEILTAVLAELTGYRTGDDVTLVILKRKG